jgi:hypothetical protein
VIYYISLFRKHYNHTWSTKEASVINASLCSHHEHKQWNEQLYLIYTCVNPLPTEDEVDVISWPLDRQGRAIVPASIVSLSHISPGLTNFDRCIITYDDHVHKHIAIKPPRLPVVKTLGHVYTVFPVIF